MHTQIRSMFNRLTDLGYTRSGKEAFGFYLAYLLVIILLGALASALFSSVGVGGMHENFRMGAKIGTIVAIISCISLTYIIFAQKKLAKSFSSILLTLLAGILAMIGGGILGLIIPAYLSTKGTKSGKKSAPKKKGKKK